MKRFQVVRFYRIWIAIFMQHIWFDMSHVLAFHPGVSHNLFTSHNNIKRWHPRIFRQLKSTAIVDNSTNRSMFTKEKLRNLTIPQLKVVIEKICPGVKISHLRLKSDYIDFLLQNHQDKQYHHPENTEKNQGQQRNERNPRAGLKKIRKMPLLEDTRDDTNALSDNGSFSSLGKSRRNIIEDVLNRYPPLRKKDYSSEIDMRQIYHPMVANSTSKEMDVIMLGTASCVPGSTRGVSCTALRMAETGTWIFDCGESTQLQIQRTSYLKPNKVSKIFITHAHGDHSFGLPGLLCLMGQSKSTRDGEPVDIYGPKGLRKWLRVAIRYSVSRIVPRYRVHELLDIPMAPKWKYNKHFSKYSYKGGTDSHQGFGWDRTDLASEDPTSWVNCAQSVHLPPSAQFGEVAGGRNICPSYTSDMCSDGAPIWLVDSGESFDVYAAPMSHGVPCVGYVVNENARPGRLNPESIIPLIESNMQALKDTGMKRPIKLLAHIKELPEGESYTFPDGSKIYQNDVVEPPRKGRKIVICGDTNCCDAITGLAQGADLLIHEATNSYIKEMDKDTTMSIVEKDTIRHGHSTPVMAGNFAKRIGAKRLLMNHFSPRYKGNVALDSLSVMTQIEYQAMKSSGLPEDKVAASWDLMVLPLPIPE